MNLDTSQTMKKKEAQIGIIDRSFSFQTAVKMAQHAINHHIALHTTLSSHDVVDYCLIPKNDFYLEGKGSLFEFLD
ncbi:hypothetical protein Taro_021551 [Colocasia esculenta]|uniref:Uncharacterized protein n=1 Tax=Colocasia esculenta TaxID=4460 RepID=A0A843V8J6_COLES|nr:hypothetical protein [Colocasia esculenta]